MEEKSRVGNERGIFGEKNAEEGWEKKTNLELMLKFVVFLLVF